MKKYMLLHCKYVGNVCQKPKTERSSSFGERKESPPTTAMAAQSPALGSWFVPAC